MTAADASPEVARMTARYDAVCEASIALEVLLPGWPAARWRELAPLIEHETSRRVP